MAGRLSNLSVFQHGTDSLNPELVHHLQLTPDQVTAVEVALTATAKSIESKIVEHAELKRTADGDTYFSIPAVGDAERLKSELEAALARAVGGERAIILAEMAAPSFQLGYFGQYPQELFIEDHVDPEGRESTVLMKKFLHGEMWIPEKLAQPVATAYSSKGYQQLLDKYRVGIGPQ
jgi:hypothetical protein